MVTDVNNGEELVEAVAQVRHLLGCLVGTPRQKMPESWLQALHMEWDVFLKNTLRKVEVCSRLLAVDISVKACDKFGYREGQTFQTEKGRAKVGDPLPAS